MIGTIRPAIGAYLVGYLGVHENITDWDDTYVVTHRATGFRVASGFQSSSDALFVAAAIVRALPDDPLEGEDHVSGEALVAVGRGDERMVRLHAAKEAAVASLTPKDPTP